MQSDVVLAEQNQVSVLMSAPATECGRVVVWIVPWLTALEDWTSRMAGSHQRVVRWDSPVSLRGCECRLEGSLLPMVTLIS